MAGIIPIRIHFLLLAVVGCCSCSEAPSKVEGPVAEEMAFADILLRPSNYSRKRVQLTGYARIEFEGNALYMNLRSCETREASKAVWLTLGWPLPESLLAHDGQHVVVEGVFNPDNRGHFGLFAGALEDIGRIEPVARRLADSECPKDGVPPPPPPPPPRR